MAINIADSFNRTTAQPPFIGVVFADLTERDAYANTLRYEGMECYVVAEELYYSLVGGIANGNWIERAGGSGSGVVVVADLTARNAIPELERTNGMLVQVISEDQIYKLIGLPLGATTTDTDWDAVITSKATQVITAKDIDGGAASNTSRSTIPRAATIEAAAALVRKKATLLYNDFTNKFLKDNGTDLKSIPDFGDVNIFAQEIAADNVIGSWTQNLSGITATFAKGTDSRLGTCYKLDITSASSGTGGTYTVRKDFAVPEGVRGTFVELSYDYVSTVSKTGTCVMVYDVTNSTMIVPHTDIQSQPDPTSLTTKGFITFSVPSTCATLRVFIGRAVDASAIAISNQYFYFNNLQLKKTFQNIAITEGPKSEIRFNSGGTIASGSGSTVYYTNMSEMSGEGLSFVSTSVLGTEIHIKKSGVIIATQSAAMPVGAGNALITKNSTSNTPATVGNSNVIAGWGGSSGAGVSQQMSGVARVVAGDIIRVTSGVTGVNDQRATFGVILFEDNLAARYADYTLNQDISFVGFRAASTAASATVNVKADSVKDTVGAWDAANGEYEVKSAGDYTAIMAGKVSSGSSAVVYKNGVSTGYQIGTTSTASYTLNGTAIIPNCIIGDKLSIRTTASINLTDTYLSFSKRATSQQVFTPIAQRYVVKTYESGASWWEVCNDGWLRQGSHSQAIVANGTTNISYLILMKDATNHSLYMTNTEGQTSTATFGVQRVSSKTTSGFSYFTGGITLSNVSPTSWVVEGYGDSAAVKALGANPNY